MGKKCKKKTLWRRLSLNELPNKLPEEGCEEDCYDENEREKGSCTPPLNQHSFQGGPATRKPFHPNFNPNFHPGDQRRFHQQYFDHRSFERGGSAERYPYPKFFGRPFHYDHRQGPPFQGPPYLGPRRRPFKFFGRGGLYVRGPSPYGGDGGPKRRWSEDEVFQTQDNMERESNQEGEEGDERPSQPVHTVLINNEEYTKIQTPRQEVIFKKSSLDRKRDSLDLGSAHSTCGSTSGVDHGSQGDQGSIAESVEDANFSCPTDEPHEPHQEIPQDGISYEDSNNIFVGEPGKPPLAGVVMQQAYPGGPMISIPVHWTHFLDPGLIPGDTALTPLDPAFTHVIDPKSLPVDPAHILPVQHDANGCPVTVQVKVNADGLPIEIEPSAFTVSLSSLEPHQQEVLLHRCADLMSGTQCQIPSVNPQFQSVTKEYYVGKNRDDNEEIEKMKENEMILEMQNCKGKRREKVVAEEVKDNEDSSDSQYASMSETSTAPTTPSGELSDPSDSTTDSAAESHCESVVHNKPLSNKSKIQSSDSSRRILRSDSLIDSELLETETDDSSSFIPLSASSNDSKLDVPSYGDSSCPDILYSDSTECHIVDSHHSDDVTYSSKCNDESNDSHQNIDTLLEDKNIHNPNSKISKSGDSTISNSSISKCRFSVLPNGNSVVGTNQSLHQGLRDDGSLTRSSPKSANLSNGFDSPDCSPLSSPDSIDLTLIESTKKKNKKSKRTRSMSVDSNISSQNSFTVEKCSLESTSTSKYQAKRMAKKIKKEKKKSNKERNKNKTSSKGVKVQNGNEGKVENILTNIHQEIGGESVSTSSKDCCSCSPKEIECCERISNSLESKEIVEDSCEEKFIPADCIEVSEVITGPPSTDTVQSTNTTLTEETTSGFTDDKIVINEKKIDTEQEEITSVDNDPKQEMRENGNEEMEELTLAPKEGMATDSENNSNAEGEGKNAEGESPNDDTVKEEEEQFICKPGFVMVPILTPYYDPAVLYGYPLVIPEHPPERTYYRKKKKKFRKRYHETMHLDSELYTGEPFVATPNGYIVPMDPQHMYHVHGYQCLPHMYPQVLTDEGFVSVEHSPFLSENIPEPMYHKYYSTYDSSDRYNKSRFSNLHDVERKQIEEVLQENVVKETKGSYDTNEFCDSGVSESEELSHLNNKNTVPNDGCCGNDLENSKNETESHEKTSSNDAKGKTEETENEEKIDKTLKDKRELKKKQKRQKKKSKKNVVEILEPDFSSFSTSSTLRFESRRRSSEGGEIPKSKILNSEIKESEGKKFKQDDDQINQKQTKTSSRNKKKIKERIKIKPELTDQLLPLTLVTEITPQTVTKSDNIQNENTIFKGKELNISSPSKSKKLKIKPSLESQTTPADVSHEVPLINDLKNEELANSNEEISLKERKKGKKNKGIKKRNKISNKEDQTNICSQDSSSQDEVTTDNILRRCSLNDNIDNYTTEDSMSQDSIIDNTYLIEDNINQESINNNYSTEYNFSKESMNEYNHSTDPKLNEKIIIEVILQEDNPTQNTLNNEGNEEANTRLLADTSQDNPSLKSSSIADHIIKEEISSLLQNISTDSSVPSLSSTQQNILTDSPSSSTSFPLKNISTDSPLQSISTDTLTAIYNLPNPSLGDVKASLDDEILSCPAQADDAISITSTITESLLTADPEPPMIFKDLGVTEAVRRWMRDVTPEKVFSLSEETQNILLSSVIPFSEMIDESFDLSDDEQDDEKIPIKQQSKNVQGNPSVASPSELTLDDRCERVASSTSLRYVTSQQRESVTSHPRTQSSFDVFDDYDGESIVSNLSRDRLFSSSSSCSFPPIASLEETSSLNDPRVYDPSVYSKYYQLGADVRITPLSSMNSSRESTLSPSFTGNGSEDVDMPHHLQQEQIECHSMSLATEILKSEKISRNMAHISSSLCEGSLPLPHCGCPTPNLTNQSDHWEQNSIRCNALSAAEDAISLGADPLYSVSSSGIGSSLASTPTVSPAHRTHAAVNSQMKLEPHPLKNLSVGEGPLPCKAVCCSVM